MLHPVEIAARNIQHTSDLEFPKQCRQLPANYGGLEKIGPLSGERLCPAPLIFAKEVRENIFCRFRSHHQLRVTATCKVETAPQARYALSDSFQVQHLVSP